MTFKYLPSGFFGFQDGPTLRFLEWVLSPACAPSKISLWSPELKTIIKQLDLLSLATFVEIYPECKYKIVLSGSGITNASKPKLP